MEMRARFSVHAEALGYARLPANLAASVEENDDEQEVEAVNASAGFGLLLMAALGLRSPPEREQVLANIDCEIEPASIVWVKGSSVAVTCFLEILLGGRTPTSGSLSYIGTVAGLLHRGGLVTLDMTLRENIKLAHYRLRPHAIDLETFAREVLDFGELHDFTALKAMHLSSGMILKFGLGMLFAEAPDILVLGDVLAVADIVLQKRLVQRLGELRAAGATVFLMTDRSDIAPRVSTHVLDVNDGTKAWYGDAVSYQTRLRDELGSVTVRPIPNPKLRGVTDVTAEALRLGVVSISFTYTPEAGIETAPILRLALGDRIVFASEAPLKASDTRRLSYEFPLNLLNSGQYSVQIAHTFAEPSNFASVASLRVVRRPSTAIPTASAAPILLSAAVEQA